jgi:hypothetical protein
VYHTLDLGFPSGTVPGLDVSLQICLETERLLPTTLVRALGTFVVYSVRVFASTILAMGFGIK